MITKRAEETGLSRLGFLRAVGMNYPICSVVHLMAGSDLVKSTATSAVWLAH
ncbi:hypothetical protein [Pseudomonas lutea]|uniref:hypothetical protein n=1 Tax=Pseudomonas lutea TaxID=243924 RepID=UPI003B845CB1